MLANGAKPFQAHFGPLTWTEASQYGAMGDRAVRRTLSTERSSLTRQADRRQYNKNRKTN